MMIVTVVFFNYTSLLQPRTEAAVFQEDTIGVKRHDVVIFCLNYLERNTLG